MSDTETEVYRKKTIHPYYQEIYDHLYSIERPSCQQKSLENECRQLMQLQARMHLKWTTMYMAKELMCISDSNPFACLWVAIKYEEVQKWTLGEFELACSQRVSQYESQILDSINYCFSRPTVQHFLDLMIHKMRGGLSKQHIALIQCLSVIVYSMKLNYLPSTVAQCIVNLSFQIMTKKSPVIQISSDFDEAMKSLKTELKYKYNANILVRQKYPISFSLINKFITKLL